MGSVLTLVVVAVCLLAGGVRAGEREIMAMRGDAPGGGTVVNQVLLGGHDEPLTRLAAGFRSVAAPARTDGYVEWKDVCVRMPKVIAGQFVEFNAPGGYVLAPPLVRVPEFSEGDARGFVDSLMTKSPSP